MIVGASKRIFYLAPNVLGKSSDFFKSALKKDWKEGQENTIELPEDDPQVFRYYAEWLCTGNIYCKSEATTTAFDYNVLIDLYILGEKLMDDTFQDRVIDALITTADEANPPFVPKKLPEYRSISRVYGHTPTGSPIRSLVVDWLILHGFEVDNDMRAAMAERPCQEFLLDLMSALLKRREITYQSIYELHQRQKVPGCSYHKHGKDEPCKGMEMDDGGSSYGDSVVTLPGAV